MSESELYGYWSCSNMEFTDSEGKSSYFVYPVDEIYYVLMPNGKCIAPDGVLWKPSDKYSWELHGDSLFITSENAYTDLPQAGKIIELSEDHMVLQEGDGDIMIKLTFKKTGDIKTETEDKAVENNREQPFIETTDLKAFGLKGHVKSVVYDDDNVNDLKFDSRGRLTRYGELEINYDTQENGICCGHKVKRDKKGRIRNITPMSSEGFVNFTYNSYGNIASFEDNPDGFMTGIPRYNLVWDSNGQETKEVLEIYDVECEVTQSTVYSDYKTDKKGNWISRKFTSTITTTEEVFDEYEEREVTTTETNSGIMQRKITYY